MQSVILRIGLGAASALVLVVTAILYVIAGLSDGIDQQIELAVASALLSIVGALVITEIIFRPLYTSDVLERAGLSRRLSDLGIEDCVEESEVDWKEFYSNALEIYASHPNSRRLLERQWPHIRRGAQSAPVQVHLFFDNSSASVDAALEIQRSWNDSKKPVAAGGSLRITACDSQPIIASGCENGFVTSTADIQTEDPLVLRVRAKSASIVAVGVREGFDRQGQSQTAPHWVSPRIEGNL